MRVAKTLVCVALGLLLAQPVFAQGASEQERNENYQRAFLDGLEHLTARRVPAAERAFKFCIQLFPDRPVSHYNLACTYSVSGETQKAVAALRESFRLGYRDLVHMERDVDLDGIRKSPAYRKARSEFEDELKPSMKPALFHEPNAGNYPLLVFVPDFQDGPEQHLRDLSGALPELGILVPVGTVQNPRADDNSGEFRLVTAIRAFLDAHPRADKDRVYLMGEGFAGHMVLTTAVQNPDLIAASMAAGPGLGSSVGDVDLKGTRAYLVINQTNAAEAASGEAARDAFAKVGSPVVLERYPLASPLSKDRALLLRGLTWLRGEKVNLPGAGKVEDF